MSIVGTTENRNGDTLLLKNLVGSWKCARLIARLRVRRYSVAPDRTFHNFTLFDELNDVGQTRQSGTISVKRSVGL